MSEEQNEEKEVKATEAQSTEQDAEAEAKAAARAERDKARAERAAERAKKLAEAEPVEQIAKELSEPAERVSDALAESAIADLDPEAVAKAAARAERDKARAERAAERAKKLAEEEASVPAEPSPSQPRLDRIIQIIKDGVSEQAIEESYINEMDYHLPTLIIHNEHWVETAQLLRDHEELRQNYLRNVSGVDMETHLEVVYHLISFYTQDEICIKVKTNRDDASINSITPIWNTANWNEREIYDLLGIDFPGHPDLRRIMMSEDWVGHPLRKDYEPFDPEV